MNAARSATFAACVVGVCVGVGACAGAPREPVATLADPPAVVFVMPAQIDDGGPALGPTFAATVVQPLRERGYAVVPPPIVGLWLDESGLAVGNAWTPELGAWLAARGVGGVLQVRVERFYTWWFHGLRDLHAVVHYRFVDAARGEVLWERRSESEYWEPIDSGWFGGTPFGDRHDFGGPPPARFHDEADVVAALQRGAMNYLPRGPW